MSSVEYLTKLYKSTHKHFTKRGLVSKYNRDNYTPTSIGNLINVIKNEFTGLELNDILEYIIPKISSEQAAKSVSIAGGCEIVCQCCNLIPFQHIIYKSCSHVLCTACCFSNFKMQGDDIICPNCDKPSRDLTWSNKVLDQVLDSEKLQCPHCSQTFTSLDDYKFHIQDEAEYFNKYQNITLEEQSKFVNQIKTQYISQVQQGRKTSFGGKLFKNMLIGSLTSSIITGLIWIALRTSNELNRWAVGAK